MKIKIKLFDDLQFDQDLKRKIELIDFPGLHTKNNFCEEKIFNSLMKFCDEFIFLHKNNLINDKSNVEALKAILIRIEPRKLCFNLNSCLFVINNSENQVLTIDKAKENLESLILGKIKEKGFWNSFNHNQKYDLNLNEVEFNSNLYKNSIEFYKNISNFEIFIKECIEENKDIEKDEDNISYPISLKEFIIKNYIISFEDVKLLNQITQRNIELYSQLNKLIKINDKEEVYTIIKYYIFMIDNKTKII